MEHVHFTKNLSNTSKQSLLGNVLVALRCISVEDKALSMAFNVVFLSLFAMLPAPMVYGEIIDQTCDLFQMECGETTNCMIYDLVKLRKSLMYTTAFIMIVGVMFDVGVWYYAKDVNIFAPNDNEEDDKKVDENDAKVSEMPEKDQNGLYPTLSNNSSSLN